jgi:hypothetical protein
MVRDDNEESGWRKVADPVDPNLTQSQQSIGGSLSSGNGSSVGSTSSEQDVTAAVVVDAEEIEMYDEDGGEDVL